MNLPSASSCGALKKQRRMKRHSTELCCHQTPLPNARRCYLLLNFVYSYADTLPPTWQCFIQDKFEFTSRTTFQRIPKHLFTNSMHGEVASPTNEHGPLRDGERQLFHSTQRYSTAEGQETIHRQLILLRKFMENEGWRLLFAWRERGSF